ncbi:LysR family transcriptional regulator [Neorhizobium galegae]|nr:LysR family transcriptional regulator [Neorhizobium galegae]MCQ1855110.1 LysR family transcriptional regulator [Neorhizobium galegae]
MDISSHFSYIPCMENLIRISLKQARTVDAVAKARGLDAAAPVLNMTQPVISRTLAAAEALLGVTLFQRGWGGTEPTAWGDAILPRCSAAVHLIAKAEDDLEALGGVRPNLLAFLRWHHLDALAAVSLRGSASAASGQLGMTQPAVSRAISAVAHYTNQPLFRRRRNGLEATPVAGRLSLLRDELLRELASTDGFGLHAERGLFGRLAVGLLPFSGQDLVAKTLGILTGSNPELRLMAVPGSYAMLAQALLRGEIDCMMGILRAPPPFPGLREIFLYEESFTLVAHKNHPCHRYATSMIDLTNENWIVAPHGTPVRTYFENLFRTLGATPPAQTCEVLSFSDAEKVILHSNSIGMLSYSNRHLADLPNDLKKVDVDLPHGRVPIGLTVREIGDVGAILSRFEQILRSMLDG